MNEQLASPYVVWQIEDGKPGHVNQLRGLTAALARRTAVQVHSIPVSPRFANWGSLLRKQFPAGRALPSPHLILGAGHRTHFALLAARRAFGGRAIVLMKPSLPPRLFDLCLVPEHDHINAAANVVTTLGVLNRVRPSEQQDSQRGLFLVGGPSKSYRWDNGATIAQITAIVKRCPKVAWTLTTSRRTPSEFLTKLNGLEKGQFATVRHEQTSPEWLPQQLALSAHTWVTEESVSMVYEALTSGTAVGMLEVPCERRSRVAAGVQRLVETGWVTPYRQWQSGQPLKRPQQQLAEADRCAEIILRRFYNKKVA